MGANLQEDSIEVKKELRTRINSAGTLRCMNWRNLGGLIASALIFAIVTVGLVLIISALPYDEYHSREIGLAVFISAEIVACFFLVLAILSIAIFNKSYYVECPDGKKALITYRYFQKVYTVNGISWVVKNNQAVQVANNNKVTVLSALAAFNRRKYAKKFIDGEKTVFKTYSKDVAFDIFGTPLQEPADDIYFTFVNGRLKKAVCALKSDSQANRLMFKEVERKGKAVTIPECILTAKKPDEMGTKLIEKEAETKAKGKKQIFFIVASSLIAAIVLAGFLYAVIKNF